MTYVTADDIVQAINWYRESLVYSFLPDDKIRVEHVLASLDAIQGSAQSIAEGREKFSLLSSPHDSVDLLTGVPHG